MALARRAVAATSGATGVSTSLVVVASLASVRYYDAPSQTHQPDSSTVLLLLMLLVSVLLLLPLLPLLPALATRK